MREQLNRPTYSLFADVMEQLRDDPDRPFVTVPTPKPGSVFEGLFRTPTPEEMDRARSFRPIKLGRGSNSFRLADGTRFTDPRDEEEEPVLGCEGCVPLDPYEPFRYHAPEPTDEDFSDREIVIDTVTRIEILPGPKYKVEVTVELPDPDAELEVDVQVIQ